MSDGIVNALLVRYGGGWLERVDAPSVATWGRREALLSLQVQTYDEAVYVADKVLEATTSPQISTQIAVEPSDTTDEPYGGYHVGDLITAPDTDGSPASLRVVSITVDEDAEGNPIFVPEVGSLRRDKDQEIARFLQRLSYGVLGAVVQSSAPLPAPTPGSAGGSTSGGGYGGGGGSGGGYPGLATGGGGGFPGGTGSPATSPNPPGTVTVVTPQDELDELVFSQSGTLQETESPPYATDRPKRLVAVKALLGTSGGGTVYSVKVNGSSVYSGSIFSGTDSGLPTSDTVVTNTDLVTVEVITAGTGDADLTVILYFRKATG